MKTAHSGHGRRSPLVAAAFAAWSSAAPGRAARQAASAPAPRRRRSCRRCRRTSRRASAGSSASSATRRRSATSTCRARTPASTSRSHAGSRATRSVATNRVNFVCAPTPAREPLLTTDRVDLVISTFTYTRRPRHADRLLAGVLQGDRPAARQERLADPVARATSPASSVATTSGSIYDRWVKKCFTNTEADRHGQLHERAARLQPGARGRADVGRHRARRRRGGRPEREADRTTVPPAPVRHRDQAGEHGAEAVGRLAARADAQEGHVPADPAGTTCRRGSSPASRRTSCARTTRSATRRRRRRARTPFARRPTHRRRESGRARAAAPAAARCSLATYDLWSFVSENHDELARRPLPHAQGLGDRDRRRVRDRRSCSAPRARTGSRSSASSPPSTSR